MKKASFLTIAIIAISTATMDLSCMLTEKPAEKKTYTFTIPWTTKDEESFVVLGPDSFKQDNQDACTLLGIEYSKDDQVVNINSKKTYLQTNGNQVTKVKKSLLTIKKITDDTDLLSDLKKNSGDIFQFPSQLPADLFTALQQNPCFRIELNKCVIILQLNKTISTEKDNPLPDISPSTETGELLPQDQQTALTQISQPVNNPSGETQPRNTPIEVLKAKILPGKNGRKAASSNINNYIYICGGMSVIGIAGLIASIFYFHQNNQLGNKLSQITDFIRNFRSNKI